MGCSFGVEIKLYVIIIITVKEYFDISTQQAKRITKEDQEQFKKNGKLEITLTLPSSNILCQTSNQPTSKNST